MALFNVNTVGGTNTKDATATAPDILAGKTAYVNKDKITGNMPNRSGSILSGTFNSGRSGYIRGQMPGSGYFSSTTKLDIPVTNLLPENIKSGVNLGGIIGTFVGTETIRNVGMYYYDAGFSTGSISITHGLPYVPNIIFAIGGKSSYIRLAGSRGSDGYASDMIFTSGYSTGNHEATASFSATTASISCRNSDFSGYYYVAVGLI